MTSFLDWPTVLTHCRCRRLLLQHIIHIRTKLGRFPLDGGSARRRDPYLKTHNKHKRQPSMPLNWFETTVPASERPQICWPVGSAKHTEPGAFLQVFGKRAENLPLVQKRSLRKVISDSLSVDVTVRRPHAAYYWTLWWPNLPLQPNFSIWRDSEPVPSTL